MSEATTPITTSDHARIDDWARWVAGEPITGVLYEDGPGAIWSRDQASVGVHEVGLDVLIVLGDGKVAQVSWAMEGLIEGIDLRVARNSATALRDGEVDVTACPEWRSKIGKTVGQVGAAWHVPNEGSPEALWSIRLSLVGGSSVTFALGEVHDGVVRYQPDALVVLFGEMAARRYRPASSGESAFGRQVDPLQRNVPYPRPAD